MTDENAQKEAVACAVSQATPCREELFMVHPVPLCKSHAVQVSLHVTDALYANALTGEGRSFTDNDRANDLIRAATVTDAAVWTKPSHPAVVYFLALGDRVKIGTSTNLRGRVSALALRKNNAVLLLNGGYDLEKALHIAFARHRLGDSEWFVLAQDVTDFIHSKTKAALPPPRIIQQRPRKAEVRRPGTDDERRQFVRALIRDTDAGILTVDIWPALTEKFGDRWDRTVVTSWLSDDVRAGRIHRVGKGQYIEGPDPADRE